ncbi:MAG: hypothetical protein WAW07_06460, partial [Bacteroidales bacterium]
GSRPEKPFGMTREQRQKQYRRERKETEAVQERIEEYTQNKIQKAIDMVRRAIKEGIRFDYLLSDSWFTCTDIVRFIKSRHVRCHFPGMIRMAKTKYRYQGKMRSAKEMVKLLQTRNGIRYSRRLRSYYGQAEVELSGIKVKLFFCRRTRNGDWTGLLTTNTKLDFFEAYHIYSMRWSDEVFLRKPRACLAWGNPNPEILPPGLPVSLLRCSNTTSLERSSVLDPMKPSEDFSIKPLMALFSSRSQNAYGGSFRNWSGS